MDNGQQTTPTWHDHHDGSDEPATSAITEEEAERLVRTFVRTALFVQTPGLVAIIIWLAVTISGGSTASEYSMKEAYLLPYQEVVQTIADGVRNMSGFADSRAEHFEIACNETGGVWQPDGSRYGTCEN